MNTIFSDADLQQIESRGLAVEEARRHVELLLSPPPPIVLVRPCTVNDGIVRVSASGKEVWIEAGREVAAAGRVMKFVPASGAASRMFKELAAAANDIDQDPRSSEPVRLFLTRLDDFPFSSELRRRAAVSGTAPADDRAILRALLKEMNYASQPKGLIPFHREDDRIRTPFEEQILEAVAFATAENGSCRIHFTIAAEAGPGFREELRRVEGPLRDAGCGLTVEFSEQHLSTDTLAVDDHGQLVRDPVSGSLLFRPGGHGALVKNLEELRGDIVSIKNIDNILPAASQTEVVEWKLVLIGVLTQLQEEIFEALRRCSAQTVSETDLNLALGLAEERLNRRLPAEAQTPEQRLAFAIAALDRPLRVCGVVPNAGEPGGAPFWVAGESGTPTVQIVESSQVRMDDETQRSVWSSSTHFNPVDIVCGLRNWKGEPFELAPFIDRQAVFISRKSNEGRELRALELPGLWNGAMAGWNTVCVEVPAATFAPVKTVLDLLRPEHQPRLR